MHVVQVRHPEQPGEDDADAAAFFAPDDLPEIAFASTLAAIDQLKAKLSEKNA
jgi:hypothetical protein